MKANGSEYTRQQLHGINAVSSLMGHLAANTDPVRLEGAIGAVENLSNEGLVAAQDHVSTCLQGLEQLVDDAMFSPEEKVLYGARRLVAILGAQFVVQQALVSR